MNSCHSLLQISSSKDVKSVKLTENCLNFDKLESFIYSYKLSTRLPVYQKGRLLINLLDYLLFIISTIIRLSLHWIYPPCAHPKEVTIDYKKVGMHNFKAYNINGEIWTQLFFPLFLLSPLTCHPPRHPRSKSYILCHARVIMPWEWSLGRKKHTPNQIDRFLLPVLWKKT